MCSHWYQVGQHKSPDMRRPCKLRRPASRPSIRWSSLDLGKQTARVSRSIRVRDLSSRILLRSDDLRFFVGVTGGPVVSGGTACGMQHVRGIFRGFIGVSVSSLAAAAKSARPILVRMRRRVLKSPHSQHTDLRSHRLDVVQNLQRSSVRQQEVDVTSPQLTDLGMSGMPGKLDVLICAARLYGLFENGDIASLTSCSGMDGLCHSTAQVSVSFCKPKCLLEKSHASRQLAAAWTMQTSLEINSPGQEHLRPKPCA